MDHLTLLREKIEKIDREIIKFLGKRFKLTREIQNLKRAQSIPIDQKKREKTLLNKYFRLAKTKSVPILLIRRIFLAVFHFSKKTGIISRKPK